MKKKLIFGMLAVLLAFGMVLIGCDNDGSTNTGKKVASDPGKGALDKQNLRLEGVGDDGKSVIVTIRSNERGRAAVAPVTGDNYDITYGGSPFSKGKVEMNLPAIKFLPTVGLSTTTDFSFSANLTDGKIVFPAGIKSDADASVTISFAQLYVPVSSITLITDISDLRVTTAGDITVDLKADLGVASLSDNTIYWSVAAVPKKGTAVLLNTTGTDTVAAVLDVKGTNPRIPGNVSVVATVYNGISTGVNFIQNFTLNLKEENGTNSGGGSSTPSSSLGVTFSGYNTDKKVASTTLIAEITDNGASKTDLVSSNFTMTLGGAAFTGFSLAATDNVYTFTLTLPAFSDLLTLSDIAAGKELQLLVDGAALGNPVDVYNPATATVSAATGTGTSTTITVSFSPALTGLTDAEIVVTCTASTDIEVDEIVDNDDGTYTIKFSKVDANGTVDVEIDVDGVITKTETGITITA